MTKVFTLQLEFSVLCVGGVTTWSGGVAGVGDDAACVATCVGGVSATVGGDAACVGSDAMCVGGGTCGKPKMRITQPILARFRRDFDHSTLHMHEPSLAMTMRVYTHGMLGGGRWKRNTKQCITRPKHVRFAWFFFCSWPHTVRR